MRLHLSETNVEVYVIPEHIQSIEHLGANTLVRTQGVDYRVRETHEVVIRMYEETKNV